MTDRSKLILPLIIIIISGLISCKPDPWDNIRPNINFISPLENAVYDILDTIHIKASIVDNETLASVSVSIVNSLDQPVYPVKYFFPQSPVFQLDIDFILNDPYQNGGEYDILIKANDGRNNKKAYQPIIIDGPPLQLMSYYVPERLSNNYTLINVLDTSMAIDTTILINHSYHMSAMDNRMDKFYLVDREPSSMYSYSTEKLEPGWTVPGMFPYHKFNDLRIHKGVFIGTGNGDIWGYNKNGSVIFQTMRMEDFIISTFNLNDTFVVSENISRSGLTHFLVMYYRATGMEKNRIQIFQDVVEFATGHDGFYMFSNKDGNIIVSHLEPNENVITEVNSLENEALRDVAKMDDYRYFLITESDVLLYESYLNRFTVYLPGAGGSKVTFEPVERLIFTVRDNIVFRYQFHEGLLVDSLIFENEILDFHVQHNQK